ncbi:Lcd1p Ecym_1068 [Eremothecium cymbalariae DBVPG|uniref:DNA damage checkpoint protein LCD1 n=1 Tax=Eremothecium cymbalariae (strain CBS 270.75 / DBVPG 7215 / KCTC 17166 / NRRL Y-17582) TaxID=931890 RepID=G8JMB7_ERECY|nr:hypothetical protein Ecym_1068 [Eremothecium cymbalariae DBVPG\
MNSGWSDEDSDYDILELANKPPKALQVAQCGAVATSQNASTQKRDSDKSVVDEEADEVEQALMKARGESGMLRDKLQLLEKEKEQEHQRLLNKEEQLRQVHLHELNKLKEELQRVEDEKKFLLLEKRQLTKFQAANLPLQQTQTNTAQAESVKKRKIENELVQEYVTLDHHRIIPDDSSLFVDTLIQHKLPGCNITVFDILDHICLEHVDSIRDVNNVLHISNGEPLGRPIQKLLFQMKGTMSLDKLVDKTLENLAILIRTIASGKDCKFAVPFLVSCMYQAIEFRPSAVHITVLKDMFQFISDLVITYQHLLKKPLHDSPLELGVKPKSFQYEFLDILAVLYCFDVMELCIKILLVRSSAHQQLFFDGTIWQNLTKVIQLSLTISYRPILNVVYNTVEIIYGLTQLELPTDLATSQWWDSVIGKLFHIWNRQVSNENVINNDNLHLLPKYNISGLIRCIGDNSNAYLLENLVDNKIVQSIPEVIYEEFPELSRQCKEQAEGCCLTMQLNVVVTFQMLLTRYSTSISHADLLSQTVKLLCREQEFMLIQCLGIESENADIRNTLINELIRLLYHMWKQLDEPAKLLKDTQDDLVVCLWRIVFGHMSNGDPTEDLQEKALLVDPFRKLKLQEQMDYYEDAFQGNHHASFISEELLKEDIIHCERQFNAGYDYNCRELAKFVLDSITSMEDADALYLSMVPEQ